MTDLAVLMACGIDSDRWPDDGCVAWIDSRDTWCRRPASVHRLCARHAKVAETRAAAMAAKATTTRARRADIAARRLPDLYAERDRLAAAIETALDRRRFTTWRHADARTDDTVDLAAQLERVNRDIARHERNTHA